MKRSSTTRKTLSLYWRYTRKYKWLFWTGTVGSFLGVLTQEIIPPLIVSRAFARLQIAYGAHQSLTLGQLRPYVIGVTISMIAGLIIWRLQGYAVWLYEIRAGRDMAVDTFEHLSLQGQKFHADRFGGALVSQVNKLLGGYEKFMDELTWSITTGITSLTASITILFVISYRFGLVLVAIIAFYIWIMKGRIKHQFPFNRREAESESKRTAALADAITNISSIRTFASEEYELKRFKKVAEHTHDTYMELARENFKNDSISHTLTNSLRIMAFFLGIVAITSWHANAGLLFLAVSYSSSIVDRLWQFGRVVRNVNRALGDSAEMVEILELEPEIKDVESPEKIGMHRGEIKFLDVTFRYDDGNDGALFEHLDFKIKPGEKVGLVGQSGGGKTTISRLLLRFMEIQGGEILIDHQNIVKVRQQDLRKVIANVPQEPLLFHRSLMDNIRYGRPEATDREVIAISKMANAHEFIEKLPKGYETFVGERGVKLSGGQRQRVSIARAMLKNAPILVLDEATSALDSESEVLIQDALWKLMEGRTAIVIAHRLSTIQKMDRIIVLKEGKIVEQGSHKDLIHAKGVYAELWNHQSGGFLED